MNVNNLCLKIVGAGGEAEAHIHLPVLNRTFSGGARCTWLFVPAPAFRLPLN